MSYQPKTKFQKVNPFTGDKVVEIELCDDPMPVELRRAPTESKYESLFRQAIKDGKTIKSLNKNTNKVSAAARTWVKKKGIKAQVRSTSDFGDGYGRVWIVQEA